MEHQHTIMVVDDEPDVVQSLKDLLRLDYRVLGATRATDALEVMEREPVDVILSDQRMPGMTGVDFLHRCRERHPDAMRLLITGYADIRAVIDAINRGSVYRYITKPWDPEELMLVVREAVERRELVRDRERLLAEVQAKNVELEAANQALVASDALKSAFIRVASHELRTPLTILLGTVQLARIAPDLPEPARNWLGRIESAGDRLRRIVESLLAMLTAERFEHPLERAPTDLPALLAQVADDVRPFVEKRRQTLSLDTSADLGTYPLDAARIRDCLEHLLLNAIKFTPDSGAVALAGRRAADGGVEITVRDTGVGLDAPSAARVFEPFFTEFDVSRRASGHFEHGRRGMGLGLSVVRAFVARHGGTVAVASAPGQGSTFTITLPPPSAAPGPPEGTAGTS